MIRAVLDANVVASGVLRYGSATSTPAEIVRRWVTGSFEFVISDHVIDEIERTLLASPYFSARLERSVGVGWIVTLRSLATPTPGTVEVSGVATHPEDDLVLAAAVSAAADYLVTGDRQLQRLGSFEGVTIVTPRDFLAIIERSTTPTG
ncbi:MAG: putative toxin-antitoxin system toxin component, PIN family [Thermomicrobiales bacterium]